MCNITIYIKTKNLNIEFKNAVKLEKSHPQRIKKTYT